MLTCEFLFDTTDTNTLKIKMFHFINWQMNRESIQCVVSGEEENKKSIFTKND